MQRSTSLMLFRLVKLPKTIASWILFSLVNDFLSFSMIWVFFSFPMW